MTEVFLSVYSQPAILHAQFRRVVNLLKPTANTHATLRNEPLCNCSHNCKVFFSLFKDYRGLQSYPVLTLPLPTSPTRVYRNEIYVCPDPRPYPRDTTLLPYSHALPTFLIWLQDIESNSPSPGGPYPCFLIALGLLTLDSLCARNVCFSQDTVGQRTCCF